jgi:hypothetical protein
MIKKIFLMCFFGFLSCLNFAMDKATIQTDTAKEIRSLARDELVFDLIFSHYLLDHKSICSFGSTSKEYNLLMIETAGQRIKQLKYKKPIQEPFEQRIHKWGSSHLYAYEENKDDTPCLILQYDFFKDNTLETQLEFFYTSSYYQEFFCSEKGELFFYGYRKSAGFFKYKLDKSFMPCAMQYEDRSGLAYKQDLDIFLEYPVLLNAILHSNKMSIKNVLISSLSTEYNRPYAIFSLDAVILPDNYAERVPYHHSITLDLKTSSFEDFPEHIKKAIKSHYAEQQNK